MLLFLLLFGLGLLGLFLRLGEVSSRLDRLESRLRALEGSEPAPTIAVPVQPPRQVESLAPAVGAPPNPLAPPAPPAPSHPVPDPAPAAPAAVSAPAGEDLETAIGSRWMLVAGTIILVLGVAFFVKYAFDNAWINETARVAIGTVVGLLVWLAGLRLARGGYPLYGRMIAGGGLAIAYITAFAASAFYDLVSPGVSLAWMASVSIITLATADRQRSIGLALMAVVLAYLAPALVGRAGSHLAFFGYNVALAFVTLGLTLRHGWPALGFSSFYLAAITSLAWGLRAFTPDIYVSTEIYLVVSFVAFLLTMRVHYGGGAAASLLARGLTLLLILGFHVASLAVLSSHSVPLLGCLVVGTAIAVGTPTVRRSAPMRLGVWMLAAAPFYIWLLRHTNGVWYIAALATSVGLYTLHLLTQLLVMSETERPATADVLLFQANGLGFFLFVYLAVEANAGSTALVAALLSAWNGALAFGSRHRLKEVTAQALALAFALAATSVALAFVGPWVTIGWAAEGAAVVAVGLVMNRGFLRAGGAALLAVAAARLIAYQFPVTLTSHRPVLNMRVATAGFVVAMLYTVAALYRRRISTDGAERRLVVNSSIAAAHVLTVLLLTAEIVSFWELREDRLTAAFARQLSISLGWALYALGLIVVGFRRSSSLLRYLALTLFGLTVLKMFGLDLLQLAGVYRIVGFVALGLMLLGASFLYQRSLAPR